MTEMPSVVVDLPYSVTRRAIARNARRKKSPQIAAISNSPVGPTLVFSKVAHGQDLDDKTGTPRAQVLPGDRDSWRRGFAQRLREARIALGISEVEAAAAAGRSVLTWRKYEATGKGRCTFAVARFAKHYGVKLDDLFCREFDTALASDRVLSETGRNEQLRQARSNVWRRVEAKLDYCRAWRDLHFRIGVAHGRGVLGQIYCPTSLQRMHDFDQPWVLDNELLGFVMNAERELLLTPAPTVAALDWKRKRAKHVWHRLKDGSVENEIAQAIALDEKWLDDHPARQCRSNRTRRRK